MFPICSSSVLQLFDHPQLPAPGQSLPALSATEGYRPGVRPTLVSHGGHRFTKSGAERGAGTS